MSITFHPKVNGLARSRQVAEQAENAFFTNWIISGLELSVPGSGRNVPVSSGKAFINGYIVDLVSMTLQVPDNATSTVYLGADVDGQNNVNHFELSHEIPSSGLYVILGQVVTSSGDVISVSDTNRSAESRQVGTPNLKDDAVTSDKIADGAVSLAKIQDISTSTVLGRVAAGTGEVEELSSQELASLVGAGTTIIFKYVDQSVSSSTTLTNDNDLKYTLPANSVFYVKGKIYVTDGGGDYKYMINMPNDWERILYLNNSNIVSTSAGSGLIDVPTQYYRETLTKTENGVLDIRGVIQTYNSGELSFQFAQNTSNVTPAINRRGSYLEIISTTNSFPADLIAIEYLVISGGGGGGGITNISSGSGGGGAGGYRCNVSGENSGGGSSAEPILYIYSKLTHTITVGGGGAGATGTQDNATNGGSSSIICNSSILTIGGGKSSLGAGSQGGSGGGGGYISASVYSGGNGTANEGYMGGTGTPGVAGGGGGAGMAGANGASGGNGGNGLSSSITGTAITRAGGGGGGGGGVGGAGGGGNGGIGFGNGTNGTANTGSGGGGKQYTGGFPNSGNGGSGIVIIKYPNTVTCNVGAGLTSTETTSGGFKIRTFTAGTGTISFS